MAIKLSYIILLFLLAFLNVESNNISSLEKELSLLGESNLFVDDFDTTQKILKMKDSLLDSTDNNRYHISTGTVGGTGGFSTPIRNRHRKTKSSRNKTESKVEIKKSIFNIKTDDSPKTENEVLSEINFEQGKENYKSPKKAMFLSLLLPGLGQAYVKEYKKTALFGVLEIGTIAGAVIFNNSGVFERDKAYVLGSREFSEDKLLNTYIKIIDEIVKIDTTSLTDSIVAGSIFGNYYTANDFINSFNSDIYSSDIGLSTYWTTQGWSDASNYDITDLKVSNFGTSNYQNEYLGILDKSSNNFKYSQAFIFAIIANHVASSIDAFISAYSYNKNLLKVESVSNNISIKSGISFSYNSTIVHEMSLIWSF